MFSPLEKNSGTGPVVDYTPFGSLLKKSLAFQKETRGEFLCRRSGIFRKEKMVQ